MRGLSGPGTAVGGEAGGADGCDEEGIGAGAAAAAVSASPSWGSSSSGEFASL